MSTSPYCSNSVKFIEQPKIIYQPCPPAPQPEPVMCYPKYPVCEESTSDDCEYVDITRKTYNMRIKPIWSIVIWAFVIFAIFILVCLVISYFCNSTTLLFDIAIDLPNTQLTIDAVFDDNIKYTKTVNIDGGLYYENSGTTTIAQYIAILNSAISGDIFPAVVGNTTKQKDAAIITYDTNTKRFTISLKNANAISIYSTEVEYWRDLGFSVENTLSLIDEDCCIDNFGHYMDSMISMPIMPRPQRT